MAGTFDLKPLQKRSNTWKHATFDIEANNWTKFEMGGFYDGENYLEFTDIESLTLELIKRKYRDRIIYAHVAGKYDSLLLLKPLEKLNIPYRMVTIGPSVTELQIQHKDRHYTRIRDSYAILPRSLKDLCETFKPSTQKLTGAIDFETEKVSHKNQLHREYLKNDVISLYEIIEKYKSLPFIDTIKPKISLASTALSAWRTTLKKPIRMTNQITQNFTRDAYAGGRCEIFKLRSENGTCVDVNSLYPTQMLKPLPTEMLRKARNPFEFGFHRVTVEVPSETYMPILWVKRGKLIFPTGIFTGTYFSEEIKLAVSQGAKILKYHEGYQFSQTTDLFTDYINECYQLRLKHPNTAYDFIGKNLMNSTYGKFAEKEEKKSLERVDPNDPTSWPKPFSFFHSEKTFKRTGLIITEKNHRSPHMLVHLAAAITAYGRIQMAEQVYLPYQDTLAYTDTDSGFGKIDLKTSTKIGELKHEFDYKMAFFLLPKAYYIEKKDGRIIKKIKGFSKKDLESITYEQFKNGKIKVTKNSLLTLRESLIRYNTYITVGEKSRSIISQYNKRRVLGDGSTVPWHITKNGEIK